MKIITGLSEQPKQQSTLVLADGTRAVWTLAFVPQQSGWFFDLTWNGTAIASGQRLVSSPNILRQYLNRISFGIAVVSPNQLDPTTQTAFADGSILCYLLEGADLQTVETNLFNAPPGQVLPEVALPGGAVAPVLPSSWGPAGGDLAYLYPNPQVVAVHEGGGTRLPFAAVGEGQFLKRVGGAIIGAAVAPGTGDVVGPGESTVNNVALFDNTTGTLLKDGGALGTAAFVNSTSFLAATAAASGDLGGNFPSPTVTALHTGLTQLTIGSIPDGQFLKRVGNDIVGSIPSGAGDVFGPVSSISNNVALFDGTTGKLLKDSGLALGTIASQAASAVSISGGSLSSVSITSSTGAFTALSSTSTFTAASFINSDFIGGAAFRALSATTNAKWIQISNGTTGSSKDAIFGQENSVGGLDASLITGASAYDTIIRGPSGISFSANAGSLHMRLTSTGLAVTGALSAATSLAVNRSGTTAPTAITTNAAQFVGATGESLAVEIDTFAATPFIYGRRAAGVAGTPTATQSGNNLLAIQGNGYGTTGYPTGGSARIIFQATENFTDSATGGAILLQAAANGTLALNTVASITSTGLAVTGALSATSGLSLIGVSTALRTASNATNATLKETRWVNSHYLNAEEDMMVLYPFSDATTNTIAYGGGAGANNAATKHDFYAAVNNTTTSGTLVASITSTGLAVAGTGSFSDSANVYSLTANGVGGTQFVALGNNGGVPRIQAFTAGFGAATQLDINPSGGLTTVGSSLTVNNRVTVNGAGATLLTTTTGTLSTTGTNYWSLQDDVAGITTERGWVGYGNGDGTLRVVNNVGTVHILSQGVGSVFSTTGLAVTGSSGVTSFTGSSQLGLRITGAASTTDYSGIDFSTGDQPVRSRIGSYFSSAGSYLVFGTSNNYGTGVTNSALTIDYNGVTTLAGGLVVTGAPPSLVAGSLYFNATNGLTLAGRTGATNDLLLTNNAGSTVLRNPTGTTNVVVNGTVTATSFSGAVPVASLNSGIGASNTTFWRGDGVWATPAGGGGGISSISVASSNGFAGNSSGGTTPILTLSTTVTGLLKGNGTALSAATAGTDYVVPSGSVNNVTGIVAIDNGGTGTNSPSLVAGTNVTITGTWPNQTINATGGGGGGVTSVSGTGTVNGISLSGTVTTTGSLTLSGALSGDISATTSKSAATGAVLRSFTSRDGDVVNVKDFGASTAKNAGENTIAFGLAIDAAIAFPKGAIYVPTGTYKLNRLVISSAVPLTIYGDGEGSILQAYDTNGLIEFSSAANYATLEIRNLRMEAKCLSSAAVTGSFLPTAAIHIVNAFKLTSVTIAGGGNVATEIWSRAVKVSYAHNALISNCLFDGGSGNHFSNNRAFEMVATCVNMIFSNTNFSFWDRGYSCEVYAEGASFTNCYFICNTVCSYTSVASDALRITGLQFVNCNFDARDANSYVLYCNNVQGLLVSNSYILGGSGTTGGMRLIQTQFSSITGNKFFSTGQYGITLENAVPAVYDNQSPPQQIGCNAVSITGNNFVGDAYSVLVGSLTMNTVVQNNVRARAYSVGSPVTFQGAQMAVVNLNTNDASGGVTRGNYIQP